VPLCGREAISTVADGTKRWFQATHDNYGRLSSNESFMTAVMCCNHNLLFHLNVNLI